MLFDLQRRPSHWKGEHDVCSGHVSILSAPPHTPGTCMCVQLFLSRLKDETPCFHGDNG